MNLYKIYRSFGSIDKDIRKHELIAVVPETSIEAAEEVIYQEIKDDMLGRTDLGYRDFKAEAYDLEPAEDHHKSKRYDYCATGIIYPDFSDKNIMIEYGIIEATSKEDY